MATITYQGKQYSNRDGETLLQAMMRHGVTVPFSCGNGVCHVCMQRCEKGDVPADSQKGLRETLKSLGYFLPCKCIPQSDMVVVSSRDADLFNRAVIYKKELLGPDVCRLLLEPATQLYYHAGQFINLRNDKGLARSYSLASVPQEDYFLELHVKRIHGGAMSNWIFDILSEGDELEFQGPSGKSYYVAGDRDQPLLLIGTGTGLAPLIGVARDGLINGHSGPVHLYHGSRTAQGLYLRDVLSELATKYHNFHPVCCVSGETAEDCRRGRANAAALADHADLKGWRIYLCGQPEMVEATKQAVVAAGANPLLVHTDPFWNSAHFHDDGQTTNTATDEEADTNTVTLERKYPDPDPELWQALDDGRLLSKILAEFYDRVYADPLLSPFFEDVTKRRVREKQYNFLCQVLTGEKVYFGERPRNSHHWMVISDELFDHREELFASCMRKFGVSEQFVRRLRAIHEIYREDIVKKEPWNKILFGREIPVEGFDEMVLEDATLCDGCEQEITAGSQVQYHVRLGKVYCNQCQNNCG
jgi:NAD(P)H-flavin reductase/ferredoxin/truncated hemoglobin YjbI